MRINAINLENSTKKYSSKNIDKYPAFKNLPSSNVFNEFQIPYNQNKNTINSVSNFKKNKFKINLKTIIISSAALLAGILILTKLFKQGKVKPDIKKTDETIEFLKTKYNNIVTEFPEDKKYYESLAKSIGLKSGEEYKLSSIVGSN